MGEGMSDKWLELNKASWNERAPIHVRSPMYDVEGFKAGRNSLVHGELDAVEDVAGKELVHLQCHFGLDTLSWARGGAKVTGLDFSEPAIQAAREIANEIGIEAEFVVANVYDAPKVLGRAYDIVYSGIGAICWLPDIDAWARVVAAVSSCVRRSLATARLSSSTMRRSWRIHWRSSTPAWRSSSRMAGEWASAMARARVSRAA